MDTERPKSFTKLFSSLKYSKRQTGRILKSFAIYMERLIRNGNYKEAEKFGETFRKYNFHCWLAGARTGNIFKSK